MRNRQPSPFDKQTTPGERIMIGSNLQFHMQYSGYYLRTLDTLERMAITFGIMHFMVMIALVVYVTRSIEQALTVSLVEPVLQPYFFWLHERVWRWYDRRSKARHPLWMLVRRTPTYVVVHCAVAVGSTLAVTRDLDTALRVGLLDLAVQTVAYNVHNIAWWRYTRRNPAHVELALSHSC